MTRLPCSAQTRDQRGVVAAEFAASLLALTLVLGALCWGMALGVTQLRAHDAATQVVRQEARGNHAAAQAVAQQPGAHVDASRRGDQVTVTVTMTSPGLGGMLPAQTMRASATADLEPGEA